MDHTRLVAALMLLSLGTAKADTLLVPQQFTTIQAAVDASANGDTILVKGGVYPENVSVTSKDSLTIQGKGKVTIDAQGVGNGLALSFCTNSRVERIGVQGAETYGITLAECHGTTVLKCRVDGSGNDGVHVQNSDHVTLEACVVTDSGDNGITLGDGAAGPADACLVLHGKIIQAVNYGLSVSGTGNSVIGNVVKQAQFVGLAVESSTPSANNIFTGNKVLDSNQGFELSGDGNVLVGNGLVQCASYAILIQDGNGDLISGNTISKSEGVGIFSNSGVAGLVISQNKISHIADAGVDLVCDGFVLQGNVITASGSDGYQLVGDSGLCIGNKASGCQANGFKLVGNGNVLSGNSAKGSGEFDLLDEGVGNVIDVTNSFKTVGP